MDSYYHLAIVCVCWLLLLQGIKTKSNPLPCYRGDNSNATLDGTVHLSDVVLAGRIVSVENDEFDTHSAVISYYYSYKSDGLLQRRALWRVKVYNFVPAPEVGQLGMFFLFREPNMQLSLFCMTQISTLMDYNPGVSYEAIIRHINEVGTNDTVRNTNFAVPYPDPCEHVEDVCGGGAYCSVKNTLSPATTRCSCYAGFFRNHSTGLCQARISEAAESYCPQCDYGARCQAPQDLVPGEQTVSTTTVANKCSCGHFRCENVLHQVMCGSDGKTYSGQCQMKLESCIQRRNIHMLYSGKCRSNVPPPCLGFGAPLTTYAGLVQCLQYNCTTRHFCHATNHYRICCPVGVVHPSSTPALPAPTTIPNIESTQTSISSGSGDNDSGSGQISDMESSGDGDVDV